MSDDAWAIIVAGLILALVLSWYIEHLHRHSHHRPRRIDPAAVEFEVTLTPHPQPKEEKA